MEASRRTFWVLYLLSRPIKYHLLSSAALSIFPAQPLPRAFPRRSLNLPLILIWYADSRIPPPPFFPTSGDGSTASWCSGRNRGEQCGGW